MEPALAICVLLMTSPDAGQSLDGEVVVCNPVRAVYTTVEIHESLRQFINPEALETPKENPKTHPLFVIPQSNPLTEESRTVETLPPTLKYWM